MWYVERNGEEVRVDVRREGEGLEVQVGEWRERVEIEALGRGLYGVRIGSRRLIVYQAEDRLEVLAPFRAWVRPVALMSLPKELRKIRKGPERQKIVAPMSGKVVEVHVEVGQMVEPRDLLLVMEAMKMRNEIRAPFGGVVDRIEVKEGEVVNRGKILGEIHMISKE